MGNFIFPQNKAAKTHKFKAVIGLALANIGLSDDSVFAQSRGDHDILFAMNSARLSPKGRAQVSEIAHAVADDASPQLSVVGHADTLGEPEYNLLLSRRRAQTVVSALRASGVSGSIIKVDWKGEFEPVTPGPESPNAENRRVSVRIAPSLR